MTYRDFKCEWLTDINLIDEEQWKLIFGTKHITGINFIKSIQQSNIPDVEFYYLLITENSKTVAIVPCFYFKLDLIDLLDESSLKVLFYKVRSKFPRFLKIKTFVIGSYAASCEYFVGVSSGYKNCEAVIFSLINKQLKLKAKNKNAKLILIKEIRETQIDKARNTLGKNFCFCRSFPNSFVPTFPECRPYPNALKANHQRRYRKKRNEYNKYYTWEIIRDITPYKDIFEEMYLNVLRKAKNKLEILNGSFFLNLNRNLPDNTFFIISRDGKGLIRSMALVVEEEDRLIPLYLGMTYGTDDARILYINMLFKIIELSEQMDKGIVEFGQTSYYPKIMSGAFIEWIYYGFSSYNKLILKLLQYITRMNLFKIKLLPHVYKNKIANEIIFKIEKEYKFKVCNKKII
ncbi:hypothetical protein [Dysgonomonas termitidis]|uniref:GNAT family N-acetyltransferase n=1 Tax=Dysgonomonas termitidis TaxID=1516126 RepID=A0ABV9L2Q2_9BACT